MAVPTDLRPKLARSDLNRSLGTSNYYDAVRMARKVAFQVECLFDQVRSGEQVQVDFGGGDHAEPEQASTITMDVDEVARIIADRMIATTVQPEPSVQPPAEKTIKDVYRLYLADPGRVRRSGKTLIAYESIYGLLIELIGENTPISKVTREVCRDVLDTLRSMPANATKKYPKLSSREAAEKARKEGLPMISSATVNGYTNKLSSLLNWAANEGYLDKNPAKGLKVVDVVRKKDKRLPFALWQLQKIFNAPLFRGCVNDAAGYASPGKDRPKRGRFWVPLIALYSGMRLNEICQLNVEDVQVIDGVHCFIVTTDVQSGINDKKIKTDNGERVVPVHPELIEIGFIDYFVERQKTRHSKLFPDLSVAKTGYYSDTFSKFFASFLGKTAAKAPRTSFHSFRHNFRDALREARLDREIGLALGGWAGDGKGDEGAETADNYGRGYKASTLFEAISLIRYDLDLQHLKLPDIQAFAEG
ncbi:putative phage-related integrase [Magnetospirillum sp. XM-1]|nr:site-specific integrase [Magnetospirillum sp. XM-1]CUW37258.1 putative phage-related integrase [Magnetospirillum sp. XM-1]